MHIVTVYMCRGRYGEAAYLTVYPQVRQAQGNNIGCPVCRDPRRLCDIGEVQHDCTITPPSAKSLDVILEALTGFPPDTTHAYLLSNDKLSILRLSCSVERGGVDLLFGLLQLFFLRGEFSLELVIFLERLIEGTLTDDASVCPERDNKLRDRTGESNVVALCSDGPGYLNETS